MLVSRADGSAVLNLQTRLSAFKAVLNELGRGEIAGYGQGLTTRRVGGKVRQGLGSCTR